MATQIAITLESCLRLLIVQMYRIGNSHFIFSTHKENNRSFLLTHASNIIYHIQHNIKSIFRYPHHGKI